MDRRDCLVAGVLAAGLAVFLVPFARLGADLHHDGIMLKPALDVLSGQVLFRDTFMQYGALSCYLQAAALWVHPTLLSIRLLVVAAYVVTLIFLYASWRLLLPRSLTVLSCGLFILFIPAYEKNWLGQFWMLFPWSSVFSLMFQAVGLYALLRVIRGEQARLWGPVLGAACACAFWCRQPVGVIMTGCVAVVWLALVGTGWTPPGRSRREIFSAILVGFVAVNALLLGHIAISGALPEWWYQNIVWPRKWMLGGVGENFVSLGGVFVHPVAGAWLLLLLLVAAIPALLQRIGRPFPARGRLVYYLGLAALLAWQHAWLLQVLALREGGWSAFLPVLVLLQALISVVLAVINRSRPKSVEYYSVAALAALSLGSLLQYYPVPDSWHILWSIASAFGLFTFVFWRWVNCPVPVAAVVLSAAFLPAVFLKIRSATECLQRPTVTLTAPAVLRGMAVAPEQARRIGRIVAALQPVLQVAPDIATALIGDDAMYLCFTTNRSNPSPYFVTWRGLASNDENVRRWSNIQRTRPVMFLVNARWEAVEDFYQRSRYVPLLSDRVAALEIAIPQELAAALPRPPGGPAPGGPP